MNDFEQQLPQDNKVISAEQRQVKRETLVARIRPKPGHKLWEFDLTTGDIVEATVEEVRATYGGGLNKKVVQREHCMYCSALNKKNAIKKFIPMYARLKAGGHIVKLEDNDER